MRATAPIPRNAGRWPVVFGVSPKIDPKTNAPWANRQQAGGLRSPASSESGMLLLEVMLAVLIFSLAAVSLAVALNESLDAFADIRRESEIRIQLQSALAETIGQKLTVGKEKLPLGNGRVVYSREVSLLNWQNEKKEPINNLYQVVIHADWQEGDRKLRREAQQYVFSQN